MQLNDSTPEIAAASRFHRVFRYLFLAIFIGILLVVFTQAFEKKLIVNTAVIKSSLPTKKYFAQSNFFDVNYLVKNGDLVDKGDIIFKYDTDSIYTQRHILAESLLSIDSQISLLERALKNINELSSKVDRYKNQRYKLLNQNIDIIASKKKQLTTMQSSAERQKLMSEMILGAYQSARETGNASEQELFKREIEYLSTNDSVVANKIKIIENEYAYDIAKNDSIVDATTELALLEISQYYYNTVSEINTLKLDKLKFESELASLEDTLENAMIAEFSGYVYYGESERQTIYGGQPLYEIRPVTDDYFVDGWLGDKDLKYIYEGMKAEVSLFTHSYLEYGYIEGSLIFVGESKDGQAHVRIKVNIDSNSGISLRSNVKAEAKLVLPPVPVYQQIYSSLLD